LYELGGGWIGELRWQRSAGVGFDLPFTPEDVAKRIEDIGDFEKESEYPENTVDGLPNMVSNFTRSEGKLEADKKRNTVKKVEEVVNLKSDKIFKMLGVYLGQGEGLEVVR